MAFLSTLNKYKDFGLLVIRLGLGVMFIIHGYPKLGGGIAEWDKIGSSTKYVGVTAFPVFWGLLSACVETFGGFLLIIGLAFRPVCILLLINLLVATFMHLGKGDSIQIASHAIEDAIVFAGMIFIGPGRFSVDKK